MGTGNAKLILHRGLSSIKLVKHIQSLSQAVGVCCLLVFPRSSSIAPKHSTAKMLLLEMLSFMNL
jgi:hypothetical protein